MSCRQWRDRVPLVSVDEMGRETRRQYLAHLRDCRECRRDAAREDPTIVFSLLPAAEVSDDEIAAVRQTVETLRRARALEGLAGSKVPRRLILGAMAATLLIAVTLIPQPRSPERSASVPFAGAVGVGSGLVQIPEGPSLATNGVLQVELHRGAEVEPGFSSSVPDRLWEVDIPTGGEMHVERELGGGYRLHFSLGDSLDGNILELRDFELLRAGEQGEVSLLAADLLSELNRPMIVDVPADGMGAEPLWLELTWSKSTMASR